MARANTGTIAYVANWIANITVVKTAKAFRDRAILDFPGKPMSTDQWVPCFVWRQLSVPLIGCRSYPKPATLRVIRLLNFCPEPCFESSSLLVTEPAALQAAMFGTPLNITRPKPQRLAADLASDINHSPRLIYNAAGSTAELALAIS